MGAISIHVTTYIVGLMLKIKSQLKVWNIRIKKPLW